MKRVAGGGSPATRPGPHQRPGSHARFLIRVWSLTIEELGEGPLA